jgi:cob(I)alamin adenosyltransferase
MSTVKIYTRKGDDGKTHLCAGPRVPKDDPHIEACGTVDELNAWLGLARAEPLAEDIDELLHRVQHELFRVGADLAMPGPAAGALGMLGDQAVERLEREIDLHDGQSSPGALAPVIRYLNRLSDLLFVLPRVLNARASVGDESWRKERPGSP